MKHAITRAVSRRIVACELTHVARTTIDLEVARRQHAAYEGALRSCGVEVHQLPEVPDLADSVFVEDTAIVLDDLAVMMRPGAASRRPEVASVRAALASYREILDLVGPGTMDGGDVLTLGKTLWVGISSRTTMDAVRELAALVTPRGYRVEATAVRGALHLKTAVTQVGPDLLAVNPEWIDVATFPGYRQVTVDPSEPFAANAVLLNGRVIHSTQFPRTQELLRAGGVDVVGVDASELAKAEGGVTCCSLLVS
ncbi:MAG: dimethylargininase [Gemmatimonadetes bacterium]|nr:dimethylargininase [Gemmatimonadota bacterium]